MSTMLENAAKDDYRRPPAPIDGHGLRLAPRRRRELTTLELQINFLRPITSARLVAEGTIVQQGRTAGMTECSVTDEQGRLIAKATSTCLTLRGERARGR